MTVYLVLFAVVGVLAMLSMMTSRPLRGAGIACAVILTLFAGLRADSTDYGDYELLYRIMTLMDSLSWPLRILIGKDPLFGTMMLGLILCGAATQMLFLLSAVLSVGVKWRAFDRMFGDASLAFLVCLFSYYFLHDFTQIRAGVALAFCYIALIDLHEGRRGRAIAWTLFAAGFHASVLLFLPFALETRLNGRRAGWAIALTAAVFILGANAVVGLVAHVDERASSQLQESGTSITPLIVATLRIVVLAFIYRDMEGRWQQNPAFMRACFLLACAAVPMLFGLRNLSTAMAFRFYEVFDSFAIFLLVGTLLNGRTVARVAAFMLCAVSLAIHVYNHLLTPYSIWLP